MRKSKKKQSENVLLLVESVVKSTHLKQSSSLSTRIKNLDPELSKLSKVWNISKDSCFLFSIIFEQVFRRNSCSLEELSRTLNTDIFQLVKYDFCFVELIRAGYLNKTSGGFRDGVTYKIPSVVFQRLISDQSIQRSEIKDLTNVKFFRHIRNNFSLYEARSMNFEELLYSFKNLFELNPDLPLPRFVKDHGLNWEDIFVLICVVDAVWNEGTTEFSLREFLRKYDRDVFGSDIYFQDDEDDEETIDFSQVKKEFQNGSSRLLTLGILSPDRKGEYKSVLLFEMTSKFIDAFFKDVDLLLANRINHFESDFFKVIPHNTIPELELIYDEVVEQEVKLLKKLLLEKNYREMTKRQKELLLPESVIALISGPSGSGKTSLVYQICRETKRNLIVVSPSALKSSYFGETNKLIQSLFDQFEKIYEENKNSGDKHLPVILIDECESLFHSRRSYESKTSIETLLQEVVNLLLNNLDSFRGLLCLTSNYPERMDGALNRRIPFKINIPLPASATRRTIIERELGEWLTAEDISSISEYTLSGSNIRTLKQKSITHYIVNGNYPDCATIEKWCQSEMDGFAMGLKKIGF